MLVTLAIITSLLSAIYVVIPVMGYNRFMRRKAWEEHYRVFQLKACKEYYKPLRHLTFSEIESRFHVDTLYHNIGRYHLNRSS